MSKEQSDTDYRPKHKPKRTRRTPCRTRTNFVSREFQGYESDSGISTSVNVATPDRYRIAQESGLVNVEDTKAGMAKEGKTGMGQMMEMFM